MTGLSQNTTDSVVVIDSTTGQLYYTSSTSIGGGGTADLTSLNEFSASILLFTSSIQSQVNDLTNATSSYVLNSVTSSMTVLSSSYALTASYALNGGNGGSTDTGSLLTTASFSNPNLTFTKGDSSTFNVNLSSLNPTSASYATTASYVVTAQTASYVQNAQSASYILNAVSSSFASTASFIQTAQSASYVLQAVSSSFATTASFVNRLNQNVVVTGSVNVTGSVTATSFTGSLRGHVVTSSINTEQYLLIASTGQAINWNNRQLISNGTGVSVEWNSRYLQNSAGTTVYDWQSNILSDTYGPSVDVSNRHLIDQYGNAALSYTNTRSNIGKDGIRVQGNVTTTLSDLVAWCDDSSSFDDGEYHNIYKNLQK
jgi:hypothetical protein